MPELQRLRAGHAPAVLAFELANRVYFAASVSDRGDEFFDSRANESPWPVAPRHEWSGAYEAAGVRDLPSVEPIAGGEWP